MSQYLGDFAEDAVVHVPWATFAADGASITRATNGTVSVYKGNGTTQTTVGVTDTEDFDSLTGIHWVTIDTSADAFYATGENYAVVLSGATIDGETVNAVLATFSIENRHQTDVSALALAADVADVETKVDTLQTTVEALPAPPSADDVWAAPARTLTAGVTLANDAVNSNALAASAVTEIQAGLATSSDLADVESKIDTVDSLIDQLIDELIDAVGEPAAGAPPATARRGVKLDWIYTTLRNGQAVGSGFHTFYADDGTTPIAKAAVADNGTTFTRGEMTAP